MPSKLNFRGRVDRASATETIDLGLVLSQFKPKTIKIGIHSFPADIQQYKGLCEAFTVSGRLVAKWQHDSKTERPLRCLLTKAT